MKPILCRKIRDFRHCAFKSGAALLLTCRTTHHEAAFFINNFRIMRLTFYLFPPGFQHLGIDTTTITTLVLDGHGYIGLCTSVYPPYYSRFGQHGARNVLRLFPRVEYVRVCWRVRIGMQSERKVADCMERLLGKGVRELKVVSRYSPNFEI